LQPKQSDFQIANSFAEIDEIVPAGDAKKLFNSDSDDEYAKVDAGHHIYKEQANR
jgi:hypothetical protein